jgi:hypothetical protein
VVGIGSRLNGVSSGCSRKSTEVSRYFKPDNSCIPGIGITTFPRYDMSNLKPCNVNLDGLFRIASR